jgi:hypothetical protein
MLSFKVYILNTMLFIGAEYKLIKFGVQGCFARI